jgi:hypothetical protein
METSVLAMNSWNQSQHLFSEQLLTGTASQWLAFPHVDSGGEYSDAAQEVA